MVKTMYRKTVMKVGGGRPLRKNNWIAEVAIGLDAIALAPGRGEIQGRYFTGYGVIDSCACPRQLWDYAADRG